MDVTVAPTKKPRDLSKHFFKHLYLIKDLKISKFLFNTAR